MKRFRGGLVVKAHRLLYHSTLGLRAIKKKRREREAVLAAGGDLVFVKRHGFRERAPELGGVFRV